MPWTLNMCHSSNFNAFFTVKINKMWNFCLKLWFFRNGLSQRLETCSIGFGMPQTLNKCTTKSHFDAFCPVKINKMWNFGCFLNSPKHKNWKKNINLHREKVFTKASKCAHVGFWVCPSTMHYVRALCDKYFLSYDGFSAFLWEGQDIGFWNMV